MSKKEETINAVLSEFLANASPEEIREFEYLMKNRKKRGPGMLGIDVQGMARNTAETIKEQLEVSKDTIQRTARGLIIDLALQNDPSMSSRDLQGLVEEMLNEKKQPPPVPPEVLIVMITHFIAYSTGSMNENDKAQLPEGWIDKYWSSFPEAVQKLIAAYIREQITEKQFWGAIEEVLAR